MIESIKSRFVWLFSGHYKMERFGIMFLSLTLCMAMVIGSIFVKVSHDNRVTLSNKVQYTTTFSSSLSENEGTVEKIFCSDDRTKCFILLKWEDVTNVRTDAADYEVFITAKTPNLKRETLKSAPACSIYMFGTTGYMGLYFVESAGFPSQILDCIIRCNKLVGSVPEDLPSYEDKSFEKYDQSRIYFNPGGADYVTGEFLNEGRMDIADIYAEVILQDAEAEARQTLSSQLSAMQTALGEVKEYTDRVTRDNIVVPAAPVAIRGDEIESVLKEDGTLDHLELKTDYIIAGGFDYDWYNGNVLSGYLDELVPEGKMADTWLLQQMGLQGSEQLSVSGLRWVTTEGTVFDAESASVVPQVAETQSDIQNLLSAWTAYYNAKNAYQTSGLTQLLLLEMEVSTLRTNYTIKTEDTVTFW